MGRLVARAEVMPEPNYPETARVRKPIHPWAWWLWAISAAIVASLTPGITTILLTATTVVLVARLRRPERRLTPFLILAAVIVLTRLLFRILLGGPSTGVVLLRLPQISLPSWAAGIELGGPVTLDELSWTLQDGARLAAVVLAIGAASVLAEPRTTLRTMPAALHDLSTAMVITLSVLPQLLVGLRRVQRARRLRGQETRGVRATTRLVVPVLEDAVEGSLNLASSMESRGYGRTRGDRDVGSWGKFLLVASLTSLLFGSFVLLGVPVSDTRVAGLAPQHWLALALFGFGGTSGVTTLAWAGRRLAVTRYRPPRWGPRARLLCVAAALAVVVTVVAPAPWTLAAPSLLATAILGRETP